jgi:flagellar biogenesis protein FliO
MLTNSYQEYSHMSRHQRTHAVLSFAAIVVMSFAFCGQLEARTKTKIQESPLPQKPVLNTIKSMKLQADQGSTSLELTLSSPISNSDVQQNEHGSFLQIDLPNTIVSNSGVFHDGKGPYVKKYVAFQVSPKDSAIRLFFDQKAASIQEGSYLDVLENRVLFTIKHDQTSAALDKAERLLALSAKKPKTIKTGGGNGPETTLAMSPASSKLPESAPTKDLMTSTPPSLEKAGLFGVKSKLNKKLMIVAAFSGGMLLLLALVLMLKPYLRKNLNLEDKEKLKISTVAVHNLSSKQKIAVIRVGAEDLLIGITNQGISLLKDLAPTPAPAAEPRKLMSSRSAGMPHSRLQGAQAAAAPMQTINSAINRYKSTAERKEPKTSKAPAKIGASAEDRGDVRSAEDVTKLIRQKLKNLPHMT